MVVFGVTAAVVAEAAILMLVELRRHLEMCRQT